MANKQRLTATDIALMSISDIIDYSCSVLSSSSDSAKLDCQLLLCFVLNKPRSYLLAWPEVKITRQESETFMALLARRKYGEPVAYIIGVKEFWSLPLAVSPATLIPRPDTEVLVEQVLANHFTNQLRCLDLGTGTGAIALALASEQPTWYIDAIDNSKQAIALAKQNAKKLNLEQVNIFQSDWFSHIKQGNRYHVIVSNPPYIDIEDQHINQGDVKFEPRSALVSKKKGLEDIEHIVKKAQQFLFDEGVLYIEHGFQQKHQVQTILKQFSYDNITTVKDYNGHDRVTFARFKKQQK